MKDAELKERVLERFTVDVEAGLIWWKVSKCSVKAGDLAGGKTNLGYIRIRINGKKYLRHRLIFLIAKGYLPKCLDHVNNIPGDDRIDNLRVSTSSQNSMNRKSLVNSSSVFKGVGLYPDTGKWGARIKINGKRTHLGTFICELEAAKAYDKRAIEIFGEFACTNKMLGFL